MGVEDITNPLEYIECIIAFDVRDWCSDSRLSDWEYGYNCGIERAESEIECAPTVEAIPVEYIESTMNRWKEIIGYEESVDALRILIDNWKIERKEE